MNYDDYRTIAGVPKHRQVPFDERVDPATTALVIIDVQNDFCDLAGRGGVDREDMSMMPPMLESLKALIQAARAKGVFTVFVRASYDDVVRGPALNDQQRQRRGFDGGICLEGTWGIEFVPGTGPAGLPSEAVVTKHRYSVFGGTEIDLILRSNGIKTVIIAGTVTEGCVESSARDAHFRDYRVVTVEDCCASYSPQRHRASLGNLGRYFGVVSTSSAIIDAWSRATGTARGWQAETKRAKALGPLAARVAPEHTALILIDVQNDFCSKGGKFDQRGHGTSMVEGTVPHIVRLLELSRAAGTKVIHVQAEYGPMIRHVGSPLWHRGGNRAASWAGVPADAAAAQISDAMSESCVKGTWGQRFAGGIVPASGELVVTKHRYSAFVDTRLEQLLRSNGIRTVVLAGVTTNCCVESTARDASMRDFNLVVAEDCVAVPDDAAELHVTALESLRNHFGLVKTSDQIAAAWGVGSVPKTSVAA